MVEAQEKARHDMMMKHESAKDARLRRRVAGPVDLMVTSLHLFGMDKGLEDVTVKWDLLENGERKHPAQWSEDEPGLPVHRCSSAIMAMVEPARGCTTLRGSLRLTIFAKKQVVKKHKLVRVRVAEVLYPCPFYLTRLTPLGGEGLICLADSGLCCQGDDPSRRPSLAPQMGQPRQHRLAGEQGLWGRRPLPHPRAPPHPPARRQGALWGAEGQGRSRS